MARVKLIQNKEDVAPEHQALFDELAALRGRISGPSTVVLHSPGLAKPWNDISEYLHGESIVEARHAELAVAAAAREYDCSYVWNAHAGAARRAGVSDATLTAVATRAPIDGLPAEDAAVVRYVRELLQQNRVAPGTFAALLDAHDPRWIVELTGWIGRYGALAGILNTFEVAPAANAETLPDAPAHQRGPARPVDAAPRLAPLRSREQVQGDASAVFDLVDEGRGSVRGPFAILLYSPPLCQRVLDVGTFLRFKSLVAPALGELAILTVAREKDCPYLWAAHYPFAVDAGIPASSIDVVRTRGDHAKLPGAQAAVVDFVRRTQREHTVPQELFDRLRESQGVRWLVELTCLVGHYVVISSILNAFEVAPPPDGDVLPLT